MNYYRRYSGDYLRDTSRLTLTEHGAYSLLLDYYYAEEKPIPNDRQEIYLMVRAMRPEDRKAVDKVLALYFSDGSDGFHQKRADHEIGVSKTARGNGKGGGRPTTGSKTGLITGIETEQETRMLTECETGILTEGGGGLGHPPTSNHQPPAANLQKSQPHLGGKPPDERFEEAWKQYPKRSGNNPKADALKAWAARLREGVPPEAMEAGLQRYREWCSATGKFGTETVMQASRFFGPSKPFEQDFEAPRNEPDYTEVFAKIGSLP